MYEIRPESVKSFITDRNIKLPRFQRKQTWDEKKNFELCISLFKEYPLGVTIVNSEMKDGINIRWLLDGRQRRNALLKMYEDPNCIYLWAKKFIKFKNNTQPDELREMFWDKINEYIEIDDEDEETTENSEVEEDVDTTDIIDTDDPEPISDSLQASGLEFLVNIILMIHNQNQRKGTTGFTRPFDISSFVDRLSYAEINPKNGARNLSSKKLKMFIDQYRAEYDNVDQSSFNAFVSSRTTITNAEGLTKHIQKNWKDILYRIRMIERLDSILSNSKIGIIEVKEISFADSQKIFNIINTKGEKLTAVEVLSAKPSWNTVMSYDDAPEEMRKAVTAFYKELEIPVENNIVKWDLPATLLKRIGRNIIIQDFDTTTSGGLSKSLTYGFKLLTGIWGSGIKKDDIDKLSREKINWLYKYEALVGDVRRMLTVIESFTYFSFFKSWRTTLMELTNDSIALNFLILAYKDWERKGKPSGSDRNVKAFCKNCFILWDKLIYEYLTLKWRGSGDSKVGRNIAEITNLEYSYSPVPKEQWIQLLAEIHNNYTVSGESVSITNMKPILYHFYCIKSITGPDTNYSIEVDHIIPQDAFRSIQTAANIQHNLYNLGLLPKGENISKSNKRLNEIHDNWLREQIKKYEFIEEDQFETYSDITNCQDLFDAHHRLFLDAFSDRGDRERIIMN